MDDHLPQPLQHRRVGAAFGNVASEQRRQYVAEHDAQRAVQREHAVYHVQQVVDPQPPSLRFQGH